MSSSMYALTCVQIPFVEKNYIQVGCTSNFRVQEYIARGPTYDMDFQAQTYICFDPN